MSFQIVKPEKSDQRILFQFTLIYFFVHIVMYSSHNYRETIAKEIFGISSKDYSIVEMVSIIKLGGSITSTYISQKYIRPTAVSAICTGVFILSLVILINKMVINKILVFLLGCLHIIADSSILPTIDAECLAFLNEREISHKFSKIRMFSTIGHSITYLINIFIQKIFKDTQMSRSILVNTVIFGIITELCFFFVMYNRIYAEIKVKESTEAFQKEKKIAIGQKLANSRIKKTLSIFKLFRVDYSIMIISVVGSGLSRSSMQSYLTEYLRGTRILYNDQEYVYFLRTLCELFVWSIIIWLGDRVCLEALFSVSIGLGAVRVLLYSMPISNKYVYWVLPYIAEMFKSAYSVIFIYVSTKLAYKYAGAGQKILSQGVFTGFYSGLSPFLAGLLSYQIFSLPEKNEFKSKEKLFRITGYIGIAATALSLILYIKRKQKTII